MTQATRPASLEREVVLTVEPLTAAAALARAALYPDHVVYERAGTWRYAGGVVTDVWADRHGIHTAGPAPTSVPWEHHDPFVPVRRALADLPVEGWQAYGWASFELAYLLAGDADGLGDERLLHLVVPRVDVSLEPGRAVVRALDRQALDAVTEVLAAGAEAAPGPGVAVDVRRAGEKAYRRAVARAVDEIRAGRLQKVILCRQVPLDGDVDLVGTYVHGRRGNTPARSFLLRLAGLEAAGFSPEIVVSVEPDGRVVTQPLAGTRALTADPRRNGELRAELLSDDKEIFEHAISVKVASDDLASVCRPGSVAVEEFMTVCERGTVQHLASRVTGMLAPGASAWDAFAATFPAVTASGVPKRAAYRSIRRHEPAPRGLYSGAVLTMGQDGSLDAALVLRALYRRDGAAWLQAGAGIVGLSRPSREFEETCEKLDSVARFLVGRPDREATPC